MYTHTALERYLDSVFVGEGTFKCDRDKSPSFMLTMVYANGASGDTLGTCIATESVISTKTLELFDAFIGSVEKDFGGLVLGEGTDSEEQAPTTKEGLPKGLGDL